MIYQFMHTHIEMKRRVTFIIIILTSLFNTNMCTDAKAITRNTSLMHFNAKLTLTTQ